MAELTILHTVVTVLPWVYFFTFCDQKEYFVCFKHFETSAAERCIM